MADHDKKEIDEVTGTETTQHEWDGIQELNTPLPKWWLWTFYGTVVWGLGYTIFFPAWPMITEATAGVLGYSSRGAVEQAIAEHREAQKVYTDQIAALDIEDVAADADLAQFARAGGESIFAAYCSQCHGRGAAGVQAAGYPNLLDDDWLWGGSLEAIRYTISHGIRNEQDIDARFGEMPAFDWMEDAQIALLAQHVRALAGLAERTEEGERLYLEDAGCNACHGDDGKGNPDLGAPNLTDAIWLYGGDEATVIETLVYGRAGVMPAWNLEARGASGLTDEQITQVAIYVHSLGGGE
ncbi:MAG: cytochrome-c oxidase, cbb3-type subunit III [Paracoccaceae bacterium]